MKIFVTGIGGFLGSHIAESLLNQGHNVVGVDSFIGGYQDNVPNGAKCYIDDMSNVDTLAKYMKDSDILVHTACTAYEGLSVFTPHLVTNNTFQISVAAFTAAVNAGVKRVVNCSSMSRYGDNPTPFTEDQEPNPKDPYAIAKVAAERMLFLMGETHGFEAVNLVPHNIIGPRQKYDDPFRNVASIMSNRMLQGKPPIIYGDGLQMRCFSDIRDVLSCFNEAIFSKDVVGETINVGPDEEPVTIKLLAETLADIIGFKKDFLYYPDRPCEVKVAHCSSDKARDLLGYKTGYSFTETCASIVEYIEQRGVREFDYHLPIEIVNDQTPKTWVERII